MRLTSKLDVVGVGDGVRLRDAMLARAALNGCAATAPALLAVVLECILASFIVFLAELDLDS